MLNAIIMITHYGAIRPWNSIVKSKKPLAYYYSSSMLLATDAVRTASSRSHLIAAIGPYKTKWTGVSGISGTSGDTGSSPDHSDCVAIVSAPPTVVGAIGPFGPVTNGRR